MLPDSADFRQNVHTGTLRAAILTKLTKKIIFKLKKQVIFGILTSFLEIFEKKMSIHSDH